MKYLGYVLSENGVSKSADKVEAVKKLPDPINVRDVIASLGLACFNRRLVPDFAALGKLLTSLIRKTKNSYGPESKTGIRRPED